MPLPLGMGCRSSKMAHRASVRPSAGGAAVALRPSEVLVSFPAKPLGCFGDGGALFTNDDALAERMKAIRTHGGLKRHKHPFLGMNGRFDTLQAAVLLAKLPHFDWEVQERGRIGARYSSAIGVTVCRSPGGSRQYPCLCPVHDPRSRTATRSRNGSKRWAFPPRSIIRSACTSSRCSPASGYKWGDFPESERASREVLSLPMHPFLSESDQDTVVAALAKVLSRQE